MERSKGVVDQFNKSLDQAKKNAGDFADKARTAIGNFTSSARSNLLKVTNAINTTNTKIIQFTGSVRQAVKDNAAFKTALEGIARAGGALNTLPTTFKNANAAVIAGVSGLDKAAASGNVMAASFLPVVQNLIGIGRQASQTNAIMQRMAETLNRVAKALGATDHELDELDLDPTNQKVIKLTKSLERLRSGVGPGFASRIASELKGARDRGGTPEEFIASFTRLREVAQDTQRPMARLLSLFEGRLPGALGRVSREGVKEATKAFREFNIEALKVAPELLTRFQALQARTIVFSRTVRNAFDLFRNNAGVNNFFAAATNGFTDLTAVTKKFANDASIGLRLFGKNALENLKLFIDRPKLPGLDSFPRIFGDKIVSAMLSVKDRLINTSASIMSGLFDPRVGLIPSIPGKIKSIFDTMKISFRLGFDSLKGLFKTLFTRFLNSETSGNLFQGVFSNLFSKIKINEGQLGKKAKNLVDRVRAVFKSELGLGGSQNVLIPGLSLIPPPVIRDGIRQAKLFVSSVGAEFSKLDRTRNPLNPRSGGGIPFGTPGQGMADPLGNISGLPPVLSQLIGINSKVASTFNAATSAVNKMGPAITGAGNIASGAAKQMDGLATAASSVGGGLGAIAGVALKVGAVLLTVAGFAVAAASKFENLGIALEGLDGGPSDSLDKIADFAARTPFQLEALTQSVIKLRSSFIGLSTSGALSIVDALSGALAATGSFSGDTLNRIILALTQINSLGKATGDNLRQLTEALPTVSRVRIIRELADQMGKTDTQVKKLLNNGQILADTFTKAFVIAATKTPGAAEALAKQAKTFQGLLSTTRDLGEQIFAKLGTAPLAVLERGLFHVNNALQGFLNAIKDSDGAVAIFVGMIIDLEKAFSATVKAIQWVGEATVQAFNDIRDAANNLPSWVKVALAPVGGTLKAVGGLFDRFGKQGSEALTNLLEPGGGDPTKLLRSLDSVLRVVDNIADQDDFGANLSQQFKNVGISLDSTNFSINDAIRVLPTLKQFFLDQANGTNLSAQSLSLYGNLVDAVEEKISTFNTNMVANLQAVLAVKSAEENAAAAKKSIGDAQQRLNDYIEEYNIRHAEEQKQALEEVTDATKALEDAELSLAEAQKALTEAQKPATAREYEDADLALASAKLRLRQMIEDERKAQEELNKTQQVSIDLSGLTLDQVKSRLATLKASAATQKRITKAQTEETKSAEQIAIDTASKAIERRQAELDILDAQKAIDVLRQKGLDSDPAVIAARVQIKDAEEAVVEAKEAQVEAQEALNKLHGTDKEHVKTLKDLNDGIASAQKASASAAQQLSIAYATARGDNEEMIKLLGAQVGQYPGLITLLGEVVSDTEEQKRFWELTGIALDGVNGKLDAAVNKTGQIKANTGQIAVNSNNIKQIPLGEGGTLPVGGLINLDALRAVAPPGGTIPLANVPGTSVSDALREAADRMDDLSTALIRVIPGLGQNIAGFAEGGVVNKATPGIFGEAGIEAILPLTRPGRMMEILSHRNVLPPVLNALEKMVLPSLGGPINTTSMGGPSKPRYGSSHFSKQEQSQRDQALAKAIVAEMAAAGMNGQQIVVNNEFVDPKDDVLSSLKVREIAREVKRQIEKDW